MTGTPRDPYHVLGLLPDASPAEVTSAYRSLLRRHHPDTRDLRADPATADSALRQVIAAYLLLNDPERRARYHQQDPGPVVRPTRGVRPEPPLRVGPVRWHRRPG